MTRPPAAIEAIAAEALAALDAGRQVAPFSARGEPLGLDDAYRVTAALRRLRVARGERPVGRKIGFTNRGIWAEYGVSAPMWGDMYAATVRELSGLDGAFPLHGYAEPKIEPEIVIKLAAAPRAEMDEAALMDCIEWIGHGFEIVQSIFPGWRFSLADCVIGNGLHGALLLGPGAAIAPADRDAWRTQLGTFELDLLCNGEVADRGRGANVLDHPLTALRHLVQLLASDPHNPPLTVGEIVTTGTLTRALPVKAGERWTTRLRGLPLEGIAVAFG